MAKKNRGLQPGDPLPAFRLPDAEGRLVTSEQWRGKPFLLYFLRGTW